MRQGFILVRAGGGARVPRVTLSLSARVLTRLRGVRSVRAYAVGLRCPTALAATRALRWRESGWTLLVDLHAAKEP